MSSLILRGRPIPAPGIVVRTWIDNPAWRLIDGEDRGPRQPAEGERAPDVRIIVPHTTMGKTGPVFPGRGPYIDPATKTLKHWFHDNDASGTQLWVGPDGTVFQVADLWEQCPGAGNRNVNRLSVQFEMYQTPMVINGAQQFVLYEAQLEAAARLTNALTRAFNIRRQFQWPYLGEPPRMLARIEEGGEGGLRFVGVAGHRCASRDRGRGDPGDAFFAVLAKHGYAARDFNRDPDLVTAAARAAGSYVVGDGLLDPSWAGSVGMIGLALGTAILLRS